MSILTTFVTIAQLLQLLASLVNTGVLTAQQVHDVVEAGGLGPEGHAELDRICLEYETRRREAAGLPPVPPA